MPRQFVIQLENHPGELAFLARSMASRGISITHITCAGAGPLACAIVTTADDQETRDVLNGLGHDYLKGETIVVDVPEEPEGLAEVADSTPFRSPIPRHSDQPFQGFPIAPAVRSSQR